MSQNEQQRLADLHLWANGRVVSDIEQRIGRALYDALIAHTEAQIALHTVRDYATRQGLPVSYVLRFPPQATHLVALPWELLRDQYGPVLLSRGQVGSCVRYLDFDQALPPALPPSDTLRILAIAPNAGIPQAIRSEERAVRKAAWKQLVQSGSVEIEELNPVTPAELVDRFHRGPRVDIIHFYGHGRYTDGSGSLLLDDKDNSHCWVSAERLAALFGNNTRLIVLHACQSSMSSEKGLLTGVAPALSAAGVHAVVAMQLTVRITAATRFAEIVYRNLARGISLQRSVSLARQALFFEESDGASWYVPTLNIRGRDLSPLHLLQGKPSS